MKEILEQTHGQSLDEGHLGGWAPGGDGGTYYPIMWEYMVNRLNIKSVIDIGCGKGYSARFFKSIGCEVMGVEGSPVAHAQSLIQDECVLHDYTLGKTTIDRKFDLAWSCEFVEHVEAKYIDNFAPDFQKAKYLAMTFAGIGQGGHHHVNENTQQYWINTLSSYGFDFSESITNELRHKASEDATERSKIPNVPFFIPHFIHRGLFFVNRNYSE
jgi:SAM-dependent methyltransferase